MSPLALALGHEEIDPDGERPFWNKESVLRNEVAVFPWCLFGKVWAGTRLYGIVGCGRGPWCCDWPSQSFKEEGSSGVKTMNVSLHSQGFQDRRMLSF